MGEFKSPNKNERSLSLRFNRIHVKALILFSYREESERFRFEHEILQQARLRLYPASPFQIPTDDTSDRVAERALGRLSRILQVNPVWTHFRTGCTS